MSIYNLTGCVWEITLACCFSCSYCGSRAGKARDNELTTQECLGVAEQLGELGCERVSLIGGEVFMRPDWDVIASRLRDLGIRVNIITNGFMFTKEHISRMKAAGVTSVSVSIDGTRTVHDRYRQQGSFDRALFAIGILRESGIPVSVISTLNSGNVDCLEKLRDILAPTGIFAWQLQACSPMGNASEGTVDHRFPFSRVISFVEDNMYDVPFMLGIADNIGYFTPSEGYLRGNLSGRAFYRGCSAGISGIGIDSVGNVRGCESMYDEYFIEGNLRERSLRDIWEDENGFSYNRKFDPSLLSGRCAECEMGRYCGGGCRSYNWFSHKKMYESPACARAFGTDKEVP